MWSIKLSLIKVLVNRLNPWLSELISPSQSIFVAGRSIFDNVITAYEIAHSMHIKRSGRTSFVGANRVEWTYVVGVITTMGFPERWTNLIYNCMSSVSYSLVISGKQCGNFTQREVFDKVIHFPFLVYSLC